uniref:tRNA uridine 5-carboxymethylaminomethyl modification enzyme MnmG n=1 Tax=Lygus hesperus TaxID=30085 RepID=A0A0A9WVR6_LYGHE
MANPSEFAREAFMNNILLVKALILLKPPQERDRATQWADLLSSHSSSAEEQSTKNEYLWYLLLVLQHGTLDSPPFNKPPPVAGALKPLSSILDKETYQQVLKGTKNEIYFHDTLKELHRRRVNRDQRKRTDDEYDYLDHTELTKEAQSCQRRVDPWDTAPADFLNNQPRPHQGATCYAAVFSDYGEEPN